MLGALGAFSAVIAGLVIFSGGSSSAPAEDPVAPVRTGAASLIVGNPAAAAKVVVYEDFGSADSREFEIASRDFLRIVAGQGGVVVEYHPVPGPEDQFSSGALAAWGGVLADARPSQALAFHDVLFDQKDAAGASAPGEFVALAERAGVRSAVVLDAVAAPDYTVLSAASQGAAAAGVRSTPKVFLDDKALTAATPTAIADLLQRRVLEEIRR